jgi:hypothetical protein
MRLTRTEHRAAATLAFRATKAADAAARAPDVTPAQGGWEEEPGEEGGTTEKKEATLPPPDSSPYCAFAVASASSSSLAGISGFSRRPLSLVIPEASSPMCVPASPFLHMNVPGALSPLLPPQLSWRDHPLPACACAHSIVDAQHHSPKVGQAVVCLRRGKREPESHCLSLPLP